MSGRWVAGRYRVTGVIGSGGMGRIFAAEQSLGASSRMVALKMMHPDANAEPTLVARFNRECALLSELEHPNTIKVYDFGATEQGELFIAMELVRGESLAAVMRRESALPHERVDWIVAQIAGALDEAHSKGIVHRDLKPENVLLSRHAGVDDFVKLLDFGIAKRTIDSRPGMPSPTQRGAVVGSIGYMSPEQLLGRPVDGRTDVYALAVIAYEMLAGRSPFSAATSLELVTQHLMAEPFPFEGTPAGSTAPWSMRRGVLRALSKEPSGRHPTALAFWEDFRIAPLSRRSSQIPPSSLGSSPTVSNTVWDGASLGLHGPASLPPVSPDGPLSVPPTGSRPQALAGTGGRGGLSLPSLLIGALAAVALVMAGILIHHYTEEGEHQPEGRRGIATTSAPAALSDSSATSRSPEPVPLPPTTSARPPDAARVAPTISPRTTGCRKQLDAAREGTKQGCARALLLDPTCRSKEDPGHDQVRDEVRRLCPRSAAH